MGPAIWLTRSVTDDRGFLGPARPPESEIVCVDCGGRAHLLTPAPEDGRWFAGDIAAYRCSDCNDRWDIELPPEE